jgi:hypothetical protein
MGSGFEGVVQVGVGAVKVALGVLCKGDCKLLKLALVERALAKVVLAVVYANWRIQNQL